MAAYDVTKLPIWYNHCMNQNETKLPYSSPQDLKTMQPENESSSPLMETYSFDTNTVNVIRGDAANMLGNELAETQFDQAGINGKQLSDAINQLLNPDQEPDDMLAAGTEAEGLYEGRQDENVEYIFVREVEIADQKGEAVLVVMHKHGAPKTMELTGPDQDKKIKYEVFYCLGNQLKLFIPKNVHESDHGMLADDEPAEITLHPGDLAILPLMPRQVSNGGEYSDSVTSDSATYLTIGPAWDENLSRTPIIYTEGQTA